MWFDLASLVQQIALYVAIPVLIFKGVAVIPRTIQKFHWVILKWVNTALPLLGLFLWCILLLTSPNPPRFSEVAFGSLLFAGLLVPSALVALVFWRFSNNKLSLGSAAVYHVLILTYLTFDWYSSNDTKQLLDLWDFTWVLMLLNAIALVYRYMCLEVCADNEVSRTSI